MQEVVIRVEQQVSGVGRVRTIGYKVGCGCGFHRLGFADGLGRGGGGRAERGLGGQHVPAPAALRIGGGAQSEVYTRLLRRSSSSSSIGGSSWRDVVSATAGLDGVQAVALRDRTLGDEVLVGGGLVVLLRRVVVVLRCSFVRESHVGRSEGGGGGGGCHCRFVAVVRL